MKNDVNISSTHSAPTTPAPIPENDNPQSQSQSQSTSSFSSLLNNLKKSSLTQSSTEIDSDGTTSIDQYSTRIKRKLIRENALSSSNIGDKITHGIETLGSMKGFISKDK